MFGYIQANTTDLTEEEKERYHAAYCGLCRTLGERHGISSRLSLTYDLTFLTLLLTSLYEPAETTGKSRCVVHPAKQHSYMTNRYTEYAADMTVALSYFKCMDDWKDDRKTSRRIYAAALSSTYKKVKSQYPEQCGSIESCILTLSDMESGMLKTPDTAANCFGKLLEAVFVPEKDHWEPYLRQIGYHMGRYIYLVDAAVDYDADQKKHRYNPLATLTTTPNEMRPVLMNVLGEASSAFEHLPLVQDVNLLRNILYSGLWIKYNQAMEKRHPKGEKT